MGYPSLLVLLYLFLVNHLQVVHSSVSCPPSFDCGPLGPIKFPFTNTSHPSCGLYTVSCGEPSPKVMLGEDRRAYQISSIADRTINLIDPELKNLIKDCNFSRYTYIKPFNTPSISFAISYHNITVFKCNASSLKLKEEAEQYFRDNHYPPPYRGCEGGNYTVSYSLGNDPAQENLPTSCHSFQLPVSSSVEGWDPSGDVFTVLTSEFSVEYHLSANCSACLDGGGNCSRDPLEFRCFNERGEDCRACLGHHGICSSDSLQFQCLPGRVGRKRLALILGTVVPTGGIMVVLLYYVIFKKLAKSESTFFWKTKTESYQNIEAFLKNCGYLSVKRYTYSDIKKITFSFRTKLGQGGFGRVFKGKLGNGCLVAVKILEGVKGNGEEFINEVATISRTSHVNIVTLLGFCFEGNHRALIYEFMPNGSLDKFIHDSGSSTYRQLGWEAIYRIAVGIARGLEYLHRGCNTRILHFDIKPHNILLNEDFSPKISDFGLAKLCPQKESIISLTGARGTVGYIAPEVFSRHFGRVSPKSDVYSYGMMVLEMVGVRKNMSVEVDHSSEIYFPHWVYKRLELEELGLHLNVDGEGNAIARKMIIVGLWCIQTDPSHRPSMSRVVEMLEGNLESLQIPPKPFLSSPSRSLAECSSTMLDLR